MKTYPNVLITGCDLYFPNEEKTLHGDLWETFDAWVFNGVLTVRGETAFVYGKGAPEGRALIIACDEYFERRGVVVIDRTRDVWLNEAAIAYTEGKE